ncbi:MAG: tetratricopeptide repeat protein [Acidobacteriaceae bacterium]
MNRSVRVLVGLAVLLTLLSAVGCTKLRARDQLNKGVQSYKNARYEEAINHFKQAVELDPTLTNARVYLATAYAMQYVPGADTEDNLRMANSAIDEYKKVLENDPKNINSVKGIAYLYLQMKKFEDAKVWYKKASEIDPNDPETYYSVGVIDWTEAYQPRMEEFAKLGLKPTEQLSGKKPDEKKICAQLKEQNGQKVEEGIQALDTALKLRPDYDDAMAYMNLLYRERGNYECDDPQARQADFKTADEWVDKTMATKKARAEKQGTGGIVLDQPKQ